MARTLINIPKEAKRSETIEIKALIMHIMETGYRHSPDTGELVPRNILNHFVCSFNGNELMSVEFSPAIAANPFLSFFMTATQSGVFTLSWVGDDGNTQTETARLTVTG